MSWRLIRPDGEIRQVLAHGAPVFDRTGEVTRFVGTLADVTELVELHDAQRRSDERFRNLVAQAPMGHTVVDLSGTILEVNRAYAALVGRTPEELMGTSALALVHPDDRQAAVDLAAQLLDGSSEPVERERRLLHAGRLLRVGDQRHHARTRRRGPAPELLRPGAEHLRAQAGRGGAAPARGRGTASSSTTRRWDRC